MIAIESTFAFRTRLSRTFHNRSWLGINNIQSSLFSTSSVGQVDELATLQKQSLGDINHKPPKLPAPGKRFETELQKTGFTIFKPISDLGFYGWKPDLRGHSPLSEISVDEIKRQIDTESKPALLEDTRCIKLPFSFSNLPPQMYANKYPLSHYEVAGLHVATKIRGLKLEEIDFIFGGSTLSMLASKNKSNKVYRVTKIPGTSVGLVVKDDNYDYNLADPGFQFERLVTGKPIHKRTEPSSNDHLQLMRVGEYNVLFIAEVDAMKDGEPVEIACSNPYYWGIKKCLQCVSSGSSVLCHGRKYRGSTIDSITMKNLSTLYDEEASKLRKAEGVIVQALGDMKRQLESSSHSADYKISFTTNSKLSLVAQPGPSKLLPSSDVVVALLA